MADEPDEKAEEETPAAEPARETAVGHPVVDPGTTEVHFTREEPEAAAEPEAAEPEAAAPEEPAAPEPQPAPAPEPPPTGTSPAAADREAAEARDQFAKKPEVFVAGAFVGAFVIGKLLKKLTRGGD